MSEQAYEAWLDRTFPAIEWRTSVPVHVFGADLPSYACRICAASRGLKARHVLAMLSGEDAPVSEVSAAVAWPDEATFIEHIASEHPVEGPA